MTEYKLSKKPGIGWIVKALTETKGVYTFHFDSFDEAITWIANYRSRKLEQQIRVLASEIRNLAKENNIPFVSLYIKGDYMNAFSLDESEEYIFNITDWGNKL